MISIRKFAAKLLGDKRAVAMTEFALATPLVLTAGLWGLETANFALMNMRVNQIAMQISDNASRIGDTSTLSNQKIYENDINDLLRGSDIQAGEAIELYEYGRVFISSLQVDPASDSSQQYIAWQRCKGRKSTISSYGEQDTGKNDPTFVGMGPAGEEVIAQPDDAVMFVEVQYDYQPLVTDAFIAQRTIRSRSAFQVRANRDLTEIYQRDPASPDEIARCDIYDSYKEIATPPRESGGWDWIFSDAPDAAAGTPNGADGGSGGDDGRIAEEESWFCQTFPTLCGGGNNDNNGNSNNGNGNNGNGNNGNGNGNNGNGNNGNGNGNNGNGNGNNGNGNNGSSGGGFNDNAASGVCHTTGQDGYHCH